MEQDAVDALGKELMNDERVFHYQPNLNAISSTSWIPISCHREYRVLDSILTLPHSYQQLLVTLPGHKVGAMAISANQDAIWGIDLTTLNQGRLPIHTIELVYENQLLPNPWPINRVAVANKPPQSQSLFLPTPSNSLLSPTSPISPNSASSCPVQSPDSMGESEVGPMRKVDKRNRNPDWDKRYDAERRKKGTRGHGINLLWDQKCRFTKPYPDNMHSLLQRLAHLQPDQPTCPAFIRQAHPKGIVAFSPVGQTMAKIKTTDMSAKSWRVWLPDEVWSLFTLLKATCAPSSTTSAQFVEMLLELDKQSVEHLFTSGYLHVRSSTSTREMEPMPTMSPHVPPLRPNLLNTPSHSNPMLNSPHEYATTALAAPLLAATSPVPSLRPTSPLYHSVVSPMNQGYSVQSHMNPVYPLPNTAVSYASSSLSHSPVLHPPFTSPLRPQSPSSLITSHTGSPPVTPKSMFPANDLDEALVFLNQTLSSQSIDALRDASPTTFASAAPQCTSSTNALNQPNGDVRDLLNMILYGVHEYADTIKPEQNMAPSAYAGPVPPYQDPSLNTHYRIFRADELMDNAERAMREIKQDSVEKSKEPIEKGKQAASEPKEKGKQVASIEIAQESLVEPVASEYSPKGKERISETDDFPRSMERQRRTSLQSIWSTNTESGMSITKERLRYFSKLSLSSVLDFASSRLHDLIPASKKKEKLEKAKEKIEEAKRKIQSTMKKLNENGKQEETKRFTMGYIWRKAKKRNGTSMMKNVYHQYPELFASGSSPSGSGQPPIDYSESHQIDSDSESVYSFSSGKEGKGIRKSIDQMKTTFKEWKKERKEKHPRQMVDAMASPVTTFQEPTRVQVQLEGVSVSKEQEANDESHIERSHTTSQLGDTLPPYRSHNGTLDRGAGRALLGQFQEPAPHYQSLNRKSTAVGNKTPEGRPPQYASPNRPSTSTMKLEDVFEKQLQLKDAPVDETKEQIVTPVPDKLLADDIRTWWRFGRDTKTLLLLFVVQDQSAMQGLPHLLNAYLETYQELVSNQAPTEYESELLSETLEFLHQHQRIDANHIIKTLMDISCNFNTVEEGLIAPLAQLASLLLLKNVITFQDMAQVTAQYQGTKEQGEEYFDSENEAE